MAQSVTEAIRMILFIENFLLFIIKLYTQKGNPFFFIVPTLFLCSYK